MDTNQHAALLQRADALRKDYQPRFAELDDLNREIIAPLAYIGYVYGGIDSNTVKQTWLQAAIRIAILVGMDYQLNSQIALEQKMERALPKQSSTLPADVQAVLDAVLAWQNEDVTDVQTAAEIELERVFSMYLQRVFLERSENKQS